MTEKSQAPHKRSEVGFWRRVAARFRRGSAPPAMTEDYRRATDHNRSVQELQRQEYGKATLRAWGGSGQLPVPAVRPRLRDGGSSCAIRRGVI